MNGAASGLVDYSPQNPSAAPVNHNAANLVLIDNYDSFTWNVYQYLVLEGAHVTVFRNDEISLKDLIALRPTQLVVSPGPGHPQKDAGISADAITHFAGKIPVLGVCMGEQCIYSAFGGIVDVTGEILHGKTSPLRHDAKGIYAGLLQNLPVTRYHSLAGTHPTLPECLEVSSWVEKQETVDGSDRVKQEQVIMGVRHKEYTVEGCQFHPESILTAEGRVMLKNFLKLRGGTWKENESLTSIHTVTVNGTNDKIQPASPHDKQTTILEKIFAHRKAAVATQTLTPSLRTENLQASYDLNLAPPQISFPERLRKSPFALSLMAEIKRASPSKGIIADDVNVPAQARSYAEAGAGVISVLTEPEWFRGTIDDLRFVRQSLEGMVNRPAVLRKEFIFEEYQILEARLAGADTILLIVKMLDDTTLRRLYEYSRSLGMEPLVEVNTPEEMKLAAALEAKVIGVNNRNLATFDVDLDTTSRLMTEAPKGSIVCALSGIFGPEDVAPYQKNGVQAVLVGEALMRAKDTAQFVKNLLGGPKSPAVSRAQNIIKICGTRSPEAAKAAIEAGADLIGIILVEGRSRFVPHERAQEISKVVHNTPRKSKLAHSDQSYDQTAQDFFKFAPEHQIRGAQRALLVGVFRNQPLSYVLERQEALGLDVVQLHGDEPVEWASLIPVPVIHSFKIGSQGMGKRGYHSVPLLDTGAGGSGEALDSEDVLKLASKDPGLRFILAGGLNADNVEEYVQKLDAIKDRLVGVDVSSGVETDGEQDLNKIRNFVAAAGRALS
ncbi:MAG: hypothetical protein Q9162_000970 [Coniocarpon cinnabarinum]